MSENLVGYRFRPTDEELINHYLKNKILGNTWLVDEAISEININSYDPISFQSLSKIKSNDLVWYFFALKHTRRKRNTKSCYWKPTGEDRAIKDKRGNKIGLKKTLIYHERGARKSVTNHPWVMYEYHIKCLSLSLPGSESYVICKIKYKAYGNNSSELSQSLVSDVREPQVELQVEEENFDGLLLNPLNEPNDRSLWDFLDPNTTTPYVALDDEENWSPWKHPKQAKSEDLFSNIEFTMQENYNDYRPEKSTSGIIVDYYSDCDAESISASSYQRTSSPGDSIGSSYRDFSNCSSTSTSTSTDSCKDLQTS